MSKKVRVIVAIEAQATIWEEWLVEVTPKQLKQMQKDSSVALDLLGTDATISVKDGTLGDEHDREVVEVRVVGK